VHQGTSGREEEALPPQLLSSRPVSIRDVIMSIPSQSSSISRKYRRCLVGMSRRRCTRANSHLSVATLPAPVISCPRGMASRHRERTEPTLSKGRPQCAIICDIISNLAALIAKKKQKLVFTALSASPMYRPMSMSIIFTPRSKHAAPWLSTTSL